MKHTTGDWKVIYKKYPTRPKNVVLGVGIEEKVPGGTYTMFICNSILPDNDSQYMKEHDQIEADMRLISAAPELLKALIMANKIIDRLSDDYSAIANKHANFTKGESNIIENAIKKAIGND